MKFIVLLFVAITVFTSCGKSDYEKIEEAKEIVRTTYPDHPAIKKAHKIFNEAILKDIYDNEIPQYLALTHGYLSQHDSAIIVLDKAIEEEIGTIKSLLQGRAGFYNLMGKHEKAVENIKLAISYDPNDSLLYRRLVSEIMTQRFSHDYHSMTKDDIADIIDEVYPEHIRKISVKEFINPYSEQKSAGGYHSRQKPFSVGGDGQIYYQKPKRYETKHWGE